MYNISEYILAKRSAYITEKALEKSLTYRSFNEGEIKAITYERFRPENFYKLSKNFEFLIQAIFPGCVFKRFVSINTNISISAIPIFIVETYEPYRMRIPFIITEDSVLAISVFGNSNTEELNKSKWFGEIIPSHILETLEPNNTIDLLQKQVQVDDTYMSVNDVIKLIIEAYAVGTTDADQVLSNNFDAQSAFDIMEISVENAVWKHIDKTFGVESILSLDKAAENEIISPTDFLPIQIQNGETSDFIYVTASDKGKLSIGTTSEVGDQTTVKVPLSAVNTVLVELDNSMYFEFNSEIVIELPNGKTATWNLFDITATKDEVNEAMSSNYGTESFMGTMKDVATAIKIFGLRKGSLLYQVLMNISKIPRKITKWIWDALKRAFKTRNEREKEEMLEFQEKLLNDEFDVVLERIKMMSENSVRSWVWTIILGPLYFLPFMYILQRNANRKIKLRAIERLEFKIDGLLERQDQKLEYAKQEGDPQVVDQLLAEKHNMEFARMKLIEFKRDLVQKDRIRYMTFNKDLSMNGRQRIDALMQNGHYYNIGAAGGNPFTVETRIPGELQ